MDPEVELLTLRRDVLRQLLAQAYGLYYAHQAGLEAAEGSWIPVETLEQEWREVHRRLRERIAILYQAESALTPVVVH